MNAELMKNLDIRTVDPKDLVERQSVQVDMSLPREERIRQYIRQIKNPYCYRSHGVIVKISFAGTRKLEECLGDCVSV